MLFLLFLFSFLFSISSQIEQIVFHISVKLKIILKIQTTAYEKTFYVILVILFFLLFILLTLGLIGIVGLIITLKFLTFVNLKNLSDYIIPIAIPWFSAASWFLIKSKFGLLILDKIWILFRGHIITIKHFDMYVEIKNKIKNECKNFDINYKNHSLYKKINKIIIIYLESKIII